MDHGQNSCIITGQRAVAEQRFERAQSFFFQHVCICASIFLALTRGNMTVKVPMEALLKDPRENIYLRPGDVLTAVLDPQTFTAFGSTPRNALVSFDAIGISLEEAVAKAGGLLDLSADPQGVFVLRVEPVAVARQLNPQLQSFDQWLAKNRVSVPV